MDAIEQAGKDLYKESQRKNLNERISALSEDVQDAFGCLIANYDTRIRIRRGKKLTEEESQQLISLSRRKNDPVLLLLALLKRSVNAHDFP